MNVFCSIFDRDFENFKRLYADGAISIGAIITRGASLQEGIQKLITEFARRNRLNNFTALTEYYQPTSRQMRLIERVAESKGSFEEGWSHVFVSDKFGKATTHWAKLEDRIKRGVGNPCPLLLIGIPINVITI